MASWKNLSRRALLLDGRIDLKETKLIREEIFADGRVDRSELEFLFKLRKEAESCVKAFLDLFFTAVKEHILEDGVVTATEARWLRKMVFEDGDIDDDEKQLLRDIKAKARDLSPEFDKLYDECMAS